LTRQSRTGDALGRQHLLFSQRHAIGFSADELDAAGRASRVAAARMKDVDTDVLFNREYEALA
jgi:hypothetical protein